MATNYIFSGQGSHRPGMSFNLYNNDSLAKKRIELSNDFLNFKLSEIMFSENEEILRKTKYAQLAIYVHSTIIFDLIKDKYSPIAFAGHSLGEFSALYASGCYDFLTGLKIVNIRASAMDLCEKENPGKMCAVLGINQNLLKEFCDKFNCQIANVNSDNQIVVSGQEKNIEKLKVHLKNNRIKVIPLKVSGAFHSKLMSNAKVKLKEVILSSKFNDSKYPVFSNFDAKSKTSANEIKDSLIEQIDNTVLWNDSIKSMINLNNKFIEIGPQKVLSNILKKIDDSLVIKNYTCYNNIKND